MNSNDYTNLMFRIQVLEADNLICRNIIKKKDKHIKNLSTRLKRANMDLKKLKEPKIKEFTIFDY